MQHQRHERTPSSSWLMLSTLALGLGLGTVIASWIATPISSFAPPPRTADAPMVLTVVVERVVTTTPPNTPVLLPTATRLPLQTVTPTRTATPPLKSDRPTDGGSATR